MSWTGHWHGNVVGKWYGWVAATVTRWIKTFSIVKQESEKFVTKPDNTIYITKAR